jgi:DNA polymerase-1
MYTTWDIETTVHTKFKRKANPFIPENWTVTHGFKRKGQTGVTEHRFGKQRPNGGWLLPVLTGCKLLVGMNIKFDLLHALQDADNLAAWMPWVEAGGNVWDIQLAEYLLCGLGQRDQMLSLDEIAPRYGGNVKVDEVKALWNAGWMTEDIEPALLSRYLCGGPDEFGVPQLGDVENTEKVALAQIARARECGQLNSILLNMGALLCSVEMERNGMFVDMPLGLKIAGELKVEIEKLHAALQEYLPKDLPFDFKWTSRFHKSALIFGGTVNWDAHEYDMADGTTMLRHHYEEALAEYGGDEKAAVLVDPGMRRIYSQMDEVHCYLPDGNLVPLKYAQENNLTVQRYSSGKNEGEVKTKKVKVDNPEKPKGRAVKAPYTFKRITEPKRQWESKDEKGVGTGFYSTASGVIEELGVRNIPFLKALSSLQSMVKDMGTYFIVTDEDGTQSGMLTLVDPHGIIHHSLNHCSTVTARLSSSNPNLQNLSKGNKSDVKLIFVSRFGPEGKIIQSDFSSLEIYIQAILTHCRQLVIDLKSGIDLHCKRLAVKEGLPYEEVLLLAKGDKKRGIEAVKEWDYKRTGAKVFSFQRAYGAGAQKISDSTGIPKADVEALIAAEEKIFPEITKYFDARAKEINTNARPSGVHVPHPDVRGLMCHLKRSTVRTPDGKLYSYMQSPSPEYLVKRGVHSSFSPTEIKNYEVQGEGGEWAKAAMWLAVRYFYRHKNWGGFALLVNQVHDAMYVDSRHDVARPAAVALHACMEAASDFMEYYFSWPLELPVPSDTSWGASMMDEDSIDGLKEEAGLVRQELRNLYMGGYKPTYLN